MIERCGYVPAVLRSAKIAKLQTDLATLHGLACEVSASIGDLSEECVTRAELLRDFGFTGTGLTLLARKKLLVPVGEHGARSRYKLGDALRILAHLPGLARAPQTRTRRKRQNSTTVLCHVIEKVAVSGIGG